MAVRAVLLLLIFAFGVACRGERTVRAQVEQSDRAKLEAAAVALRQQHGAKLGNVPRQLWPVEFLQFHPESIAVDEHGVYVCTNSRFVERGGVFIRTDPAYNPPSSGDPGFERIQGDVYWFFAPG
jgi:hypothetical protein